MNQVHLKSVKKRLDKITRKEVKDFIGAMQQDGLSQATVRNLKAYLSAILADAVDDELIPVNPATRTGKLIGTKNGNAEEICPLSWEEKVKLEEALQKRYSHYYPLFLTALRTGDHPNQWRLNHNELKLFI